METKIRSDSGRLFDLGKVTDVVEQLPQFPDKGVLDEEVEDK
jgi:hypothetical protein